MARLTMDEWEIILSTLSEAGCTSEMKKILAKKYNVDVRSINRQWQKKFGNQREERADKGKRKIDKTTYNQLAVLTTTYKRTAEDSIKDLVLQGKIKGKIVNGQLKEAEIHPATLNRYLREDDLNKKSRLKSASFRMTAKHPLHVLQWDSTRATQWYVEKNEENETIIGFSEEWSENKNRTNKKEKLTFMVFQDMYSRKVWYKVTDHENAYTWLEFFYEVISEVGIPENIYSDNASFFKKGGQIRTVLEELDCNFLSHLPGNSQAKGMVERSIQYLEKHATVTLVEKAKTLTSYNQVIKTIEQSYNHRKHSTTEQIPDDLFYAQLRFITVKLSPSLDDFLRLCPKWEYRVLKNNLTVEWKSRKYQCLDEKAILVNYINKKIRVEEHPKREDIVYFVIEGREIEARDIKIHGEKTTTFGEFKSMPESRKEKMISELEEYKADRKLKSKEGLSYEDELRQKHYEENKVSASYEERLNQHFQDYSKQYLPPQTVDFQTEQYKRKGPEVDFDEAKYHIASNGIAVTLEIEKTLINLFGDRDKVREIELDYLIRKEKQRGVK